MNQATKILNTLGKNTTTPGVTTAALAKSAGVPKSAISKRVADLREAGHQIFTNYRNYRGVRKAYYRLAA